NPTDRHERPVNDGERNRRATSPAKSKKPGNQGAKKKENLDRRKQLFNDRKCGPIERIQIPTEMITRLWGVLYDLDPDTFRSKVVPAAARNDPRKFYKKVVRPWLRRDSILNGGEVTLSGRGLHAISWFDKPVEFESDGQRRRWAGIVRALQAILPSDPDAPGITATTRAIGSINSKNQVKVTRLHRGRPVAV